MAAAVTRPDPPSASPPERGAIARHRWTVAGYYRQADAGMFDEDSRIELLDGEVVDMAPIGSTQAYSLDKLARSLYRAWRAFSDPRSEPYPPRRIQRPPARPGGRARSRLLRRASAGQRHSARGRGCRFFAPEIVVAVVGM